MGMANFLVKLIKAIIIIATIMPKRDNKYGTAISYGYCLYFGEELNK